MYGQRGDDTCAAPYAVRLGVALQLTNILRDVGADAGRGRIYLPQMVTIRMVSEAMWDY